MDNRSSPSASPHEVLLPESTRGSLQMEATASTFTLEHRPLLGGYSSTGSADATRQCSLWSQCCRAVHESAERLVILPDEAAWLKSWDISIVMLLFITAFYEPVAVAVLDRDPHWARSLNVFLDAAFSIDMLLQFFIAYAEPVESTALHSLWVRDLGQIAVRYCRFPLSQGGKAGWFWIDLVTVLPGWFNVLQDGWSRRNTELKLLRLLRLVRLSKLVRLSNIVARWHQKYGFAFYTAELTQFAFITTLTIHWMACVWVIFEGRISIGKLSYATDKESWLSALISAKGDSCSPDASQDPACVFSIAVYWATMTLTTAGYGDVGPQNPVEYMVCTCCMLCVAYIWAYILAKIVTILGDLDPHEQCWRQEIDDLQDLMDKRVLPGNLQVRLRRYMHEAKNASLQRRQQDQLCRISESLQREVAMHSGALETFCKGVYWARDLQQDALLDLMRCLQPFCFGPYESMTQPQALIIMRRGIAVARCRILNRGDIWGQHDILMVTEALVDSNFPRTLSYVDTLILHRSSLVDVCRVFPHMDKRIRRAQIRTACFRAFIKTARQRCSTFRLKQGTRMTFSAATSFVSPGHSKMHMSGLSHPKENTSLVDLKFVMDRLEKRHAELEDIFSEVNLRLSKRRPCV